MLPLSPLDKSIIATINMVRAEHHACTAGAVALRLQLSKSYIINRCEILRASGVITWTSFPGSLRVVTPEAVDAAEPTAAPVDAPIVSSLPVTEPPKPPAKRAGRPRKNVDSHSN